MTIQTYCRHNLCNLWGWLLADLKKKNLIHKLINENDISL